MSDPLSASAAAYDALPYPSLPRAVTQPDRLAVVARLFGLSPAPPSRCRVLELGCSDGGNLLATALAHPGAEVVGVDISPGQVEAGRAAARALGATNLRLEVMDLREASALGTFDYVVAHGLYGWIAPPLQAALLDVVAGALRPQGVAYLGVSVLPGSYPLLAMRELLLRRLAGVVDPADRVRAARATVEALAEVAPPATAGPMRAMRDKVRRSSDAWVRHDLLVEDNHPTWFRDLAGATAARGLQYLADADLPTTLPSTYLDPERVKLFDRLARDPVEREQLLDELTDRTFRRALFVPEGAEVDRKVGAGRLAGLSLVARYRRPEAWPDLALGAHEAFRAEPEERGQAVAAPAELRTRHPLARAALRLVAERWPLPEPVDGLAERARARAAEAGWPTAAPAPEDEPIVAEHLLVAAMRGLVDLWLEPPAFAPTPGERPVASPLARWRAAGGHEVVNVLHQAVPLEPHERLLLAALDGSRDRPALVAELAARAAAGDLTLADGDRPIVDAAERDALLAGVVDRTLAWFGRAALLVG
ncbi:MAG: methyltransferase regulatory domain-containing protein [Planctomycetes bacterium]|nr:methyltransferase regulatory domain-containing protein [Planctomycetota bacterium]